MSFTRVITLRLLDTVDVTTLTNAVASFLGEDADGLTVEQADALAVRRFFLGEYKKEINRVDAVNATASDRADLDAARATSVAKEESITAKRRELQEKAEADWEI